MTSGNVEIVNRILDTVAGCKYLGVRPDFKLKVQTALLTVRTRLHAHFHRALADFRIVSVPGVVVNCVIFHLSEGRNGFSGNGLIDRVAEIGVRQCIVYLVAAFHYVHNV